MPAVDVRVQVSIEQREDLLRYVILKKNIISETAFRSSCLAIKGQMIQLITTAPTIPAAKAIPVLKVTVRTDGDSPSSSTKVSEVIVKARHPTSPDRWTVVSNLFDVRSRVRVNVLDESSG